MKTQRTFADTIEALHTDTVVIALNKDLVTVDQDEAGNPLLILKGRALEDFDGAVFTNEFHGYAQRMGVSVEILADRVQEELRKEDRIAILRTVLI